MKHVYLHTKAGLTVTLDGRVYSIPSDHPEFKSILAFVVSGEPESRVLELVEREARRIQKAMKRRFSANLEYNEGCILYKGTPIYGAAITRMLAMLEAGLDIGPLAAFVEKERLNPDVIMIEHLYTFLEFGRIPLTHSGDFLVYKAVRADYKDIHSGTFMNSVGSVCEMPRERVDPDRQSTCSYGLHVCSYAYLPHFSQANGHVMICKVNPADVVAIPVDYHNTKMRVARYTVVGEVTEYYKSGHDELGNGSLVRGEDYVVMYQDDGGMYEVYDEFFTEAEARQQANALKAEGMVAAWVDDRVTGKHLYDAP